MNRKNLTAAVLAGLAGAAGIASTAQAVNLNPDGLGQVLIYPYYTVKGGNSTILSVVNTTEEAKAVKVRFLEGQNSQEVLDFNLYLSAFDVWVAAIANGTADFENTTQFGFPGEGDDVATLFVNDTSCTVPYLFGNGGEQDFLTFALDADDGSLMPNRTREGHFEMIEMGTLLGSSAAAATHSDGVPASCETLVDAWTEVIDGVIDANDGYWLQDPLTDISAPSGGLFGGAAVINPGDGTMYSYDARAINGFADDAVGAQGPLHNQPGTELPNLSSGNIPQGIVFLDDGSVTSSSFTRGVDAVSYVFMHDTMMNEYSTETIAGAQSEWVVTFPTKRFYTFPDDSGSATPIAPFTSLWSDNDGDSVNDGACESVSLDGIFDREEATPGEVPPGERPPIVSPAPPDPDPDPSVPFQLCFETNVIRFGEAGADEDDDGVGDLIPDATEILGSENFTNFDNVALGFENGWAKVDLFNYEEDTDADGVFDTVSQRDPLGNLVGLPMTGFWVIEYTNGFLEDEEGNTVLANYGGLFNHKATRMVMAPAPVPPPVQ